MSLATSVQTQRDIAQRSKERLSVRAGPSSIVDMRNVMIKRSSPKKYSSSRSSRKVNENSDEDEHEHENENEDPIDLNRFVVNPEIPSNLLLFNKQAKIDIIKARVNANGMRNQAVLNMAQLRSKLKNVEFESKSPTGGAKYDQFVLKNAPTFMIVTKLRGPYASSKFQGSQITTLGNLTSMSIVAIEITAPNFMFDATGKEMFTSSLQFLQESFKKSTYYNQMRKKYNKVDMSSISKELLVGKTKKGGTIFVGINFAREKDFNRDEKGDVIVTDKFKGENLVCFTNFGEIVSSLESSRFVTQQRDWKDFFTSSKYLVDDAERESTVPWNDREITTKDCYAVMSLKVGGLKLGDTFAKVDLFVQNIVYADVSDTANFDDDFDLSKYDEDDEKEKTPRNDSPATAENSDSEEKDHEEEASEAVEDEIENDELENDETDPESEDDKSQQRNVGNKRTNDVACDDSVAKKKKK